MKLVSSFKKMRDNYVINQVKRIRLPEFQSSEIVRRKIIFFGRVQKVGFRLEVYELAKRLGLSGWVKNRLDGAVEAEIQGEHEKILFLISFMKSLKRAKVKHVEIRRIALIKNEKEFTILRE